MEHLKKQQHTYTVKTYIQKTYISAVHVQFDIFNRQSEIQRALKQQIATYKIKIRLVICSSSSNSVTPRL